LAYQNVVAEIESLPDGPEIGALFDFDGTIISGYSAVAFFQEQVKRGHMSPRDVVELMSVMASFGIGILGFPALMLAASQFLRGVREDSYAAFGEDVFKSHIARQIYPETRALVEAHQRKGHTVAIISSATPYQVAPAARSLDIEHVLCTHLQVENGEFTGAVVRPICFGHGKVIAAESLAEPYGVDLAKSFFYSDSTDDLALLERVGNPRPLNPSGKLRAISERRGWPVRQFASRGRPTPTDLLRTAMVPASLMASFFAGLPGTDRIAAGRYQLQHVRICGSRQCADRPEPAHQGRTSPVVAPPGRVPVQSPEQRGHGHRRALAAPRHQRHRQEGDW